MPTLKNVFDFVHETKIVMQMFGYTAEFSNQYTQHLEKIGLAIASEHKLTLEEASKLPTETPLGKRSEKKFSDFKSWFKKNDKN